MRESISWDNSWAYNDATSEERVGNALRGGCRDKAFLMTKIDGRDKAAGCDSMRILEQAHR